MMMMMMNVRVKKRTAAVSAQTDSTVMTKVPRRISPNKMRYARESWC